MERCDRTLSLPSSFECRVFLKVVCHWQDLFRSLVLCESDLAESTISLVQAIANLRTILILQAFRCYVQSLSALVMRSVPAVYLISSSSYHFHVMEISFMPNLSGYKSRLPQSFILAIQTIITPHIEDRRNRSRIVLRFSLRGQPPEQYIKCAGQPEARFGPRFEELVCICDPPSWLVYI